MVMMERQKKATLTSTDNVFEAKYIGSLRVARPKTKCEIVCAMRTVRNEFKRKRLKKRTVKLKISLQGIEIYLNSASTSNNSRRRCGCKHDDLILMHHPIYRIFYVSHDVQNQEIFSYIARETNSHTSMFKCNVFKAAHGGEEATAIVQAIGRAFDVCHSLCSYTKPDMLTAPIISAAPASSMIPNHTHNSAESALFSSRTSGFFEMDEYSDVSNDLTIEERIRLLHKQIVDIHEVSQYYKDDLERIKSKLCSLELKLSMETSARTYLQAYNQNLTEQNRELAIHLQSLIMQQTKINVKTDTNCIYSQSAKTTSSISISQSKESCSFAHKRTWNEDEEQN